MDDDYFKTVNYSQSSLLALSSQAFDGLKELVISRARGPLVLLGKRISLVIEKRVSDASTNLSSHFSSNDYHCTHGKNIGGRTASVD